MEAVLNIAAYRFVRIDDPAVLRERLLDLARTNMLRGTILLAEEGINLEAYLETVGKRLMRDDMNTALAELLEAAGVRSVTTFDLVYALGMVIHEMGTARMGDDARTSVLNRWNQVWDAPNVFVTDGSCMVSTACPNPSLTYMALTARAADFAVNELNRRNL